MAEYLKFEILPKPSGRKTDRWGVFSKTQGSMLGCIEWFGRWRQFTFTPDPNCTFNTECLRDIAEFLDNANAEHRREIQERKRTWAAIK